MFYLPTKTLTKNHLLNITSSANQLFELDDISKLKCEKSSFYLINVI